MSSITLNFGGMDDRQHNAENLSLPIIPHLGSVALCRKAMDLCAGSRAGIAIVGPKGSGKSVGLDLTYNWFADLERAKHGLDNSYVVRRVLRLRAVGSKTDRDVMMLLAKHLNKTYSDRAGGRRKSVPEIRADVLELCLKKQYAVIMVDEAETYSEQALDCLRDLLADSQDAGTGRVSESGTCASGIGLLLVGDEELHKRMGRSREAGHRWRQVIHVPLLTMKQVVEVYAAWFPGFGPHVAKRGDVAWLNYLSSTVCRAREVPFRLLENHARLYAHYMFRGDPAIDGREAIPFHRHLFETAANECCWAGGKSQAPNPGQEKAS